MASDDRRIRFAARPAVARFELRDGLLVRVDEQDDEPDDDPEENEQEYPNKKASSHSIESEKQLNEYSFGPSGSNAPNDDD